MFDTSLRMHATRRIPDPQRQRGEVFLTLKMGRFFGSGSRETSEAVGEIRILTSSATHKASQRCRSGRKPDWPMRIPGVSEDLCLDSPESVGWMPD